MNAEEYNKSKLNQFCIIQWHKQVEVETMKCTENYCESSEFSLPFLGFLSLLYSHHWGLKRNSHENTNCC